MNPYRTRGAAVFFAGFSLLLWAFLAFIPLADAGWFVRFVLIPAMIIYLWFTPRR